MRKLFMLAITASAVTAAAAHTDDNGCSNGAPPYRFPNGTIMKLPSGPQEGDTVCNCPQAPGYTKNPTYGPSITGLGCQNKCDFQCMQACVSCNAGHEQVYEGDTKYNDGSWSCGQYCGMGPLFAYTDVCCYHLCGCQIPTTTPKVISQCLDASSSKECLGTDLDGMCRMETITHPTYGSCKSGYHCELQTSPDGTRGIGVCVKDGQTLRIKNNGNTSAPQQAKNVGCVYAEQFGQVLRNRDQQEACLATKGHGISQEKIVHSSYETLDSYAVQHAPNTGFGNRTITWKYATCKITGNCPPPPPGRTTMADLPPPLQPLYTDINNFGDELWNPLKPFCVPSIPWDQCWKVVQGVVGWLT